MPAEGSHQQRFKTDFELLKERRSIESEILAIYREQAEVQKNYGKIDSKLAAKAQEHQNKLIKLAKERIELEDQMYDIANKIEAESDIRKKLRLKSRYDEHYHMLRQLMDTQTVEKQNLEIILRELAVLGKVADLEQDRLNKVSAFLGQFGEIFNIHQKYHNGLRKSLGLEGARLRMAAAFAAVFEIIWMTFKTVDESLAKFRISMGMLREDSGRISTSIKEVATQFAHIGVTVEGAANAAMALANEFGGTMKISEDLIETTSILKTQLGVAEDSSAGFLRNMGALTKTTAQAQRHMVYVADALTAAAGIPLNLVMQDVAKMSGNALALVSKMPLAIVKSAVEARKMGTTINKMADASSQILNFTESVQAEMEASVLIGESINLQRARYLAFHGQIVESTKEILNIAKKIDFEHLDYFQMQAFAAATGRSTDELLKMIQADRQLRAARSDASLGLKEEVELYDSLQSKQEAALHNEVLQREMAIKNMANQARLTALQQQWNQLWMETIRVMYPAFDFLLKMATVAVRIGPPIMFVVKSFSMIMNMAGALGVKFVSLSKPLFALATGMKLFANFVSTPVVLIGKLFGALSKFSGLVNVLKFAAPFAKAIPVIGWVITALQFVSSFIGHIKKNMAGGDNFLVAGIKAAGSALIDVFLKPFQGIWNWIMKIFGPGSPSKMMVQIIKGVANGAAAIFDALSYPWRMFLAWLVEKIPYFGKKWAGTIRGGASAIVADMGLSEKQEELATSRTKVATEATAATPTQTVTVVPSEEERKQRETDSEALGNILKSLQTLNENLLAGKIAVYIDGQLLSATLARQTAFKGGYGVNTI